MDLGFQPHAGHTDRVLNSGFIDNFSGNDIDVVVVGQAGAPPPFDDEDAEQPYERLRVKVVFPQIQEFTNELVLERWVPWRDAHPQDAEDLEEQEDA